MVREELKKKEPLVYACLAHDLGDNRIAHSYLFAGQKSPLKRKAAILLAQSILEGKNDFACETCSTCRRVASFSHLDVCFIDGSSAQIKKDEVEEMIHNFSKTASEESGRKIYIIDHIEHSSAKVLNMLLKFIEDPAGDSTFGIFICDDLADVLPTIVSRCQTLTFRNTDLSDIIDLYIKDGLDRNDAALLAGVVKDYAASFVKTFKEVRELILKFGDSLLRPYLIPYLFSDEFYVSTNFFELGEMFLEMMIVLCDDVLTGDGLYEELSSSIKDDAYALLKIFISARGKIQNCPNIDRKLLFDQIAFEILSYKKQGEL